MNKIETLAMKSSRKQIPALFKKIPWVKGQRNYDIGGGKYDVASEWLQNTHGVTNLVQDVFNRSPEHNGKVTADVWRNGVDTITLANVLNVCPEAHERFTILRHAHGAFKQSDRKATVYISCYNAAGQPSVSECQTCMSLDQYIPEVKATFPGCDVTMQNGMIIVRNAQ